MSSTIKIACFGAEGSEPSVMSIVLFCARLFNFVI